MNDLVAGAGSRFVALGNTLADATMAIGAEKHAAALNPTLLNVGYLIAALLLVSGFVATSAFGMKWLSCFAFVVAAAFAGWQLETYQKPILLAGVLGGIVVGYFGGLIMSRLVIRNWKTWCLICALASASAVATAAATILASNFPTIPVAICVVIVATIGGSQVGEVFYLLATERCRQSSGPMWRTLLELTMGAAAIGVGVLLVVQSQSSERAESYPILFFVATLIAVLLGVFGSAGAHKLYDWRDFLSNYATLLGVAVAATGFFNGNIAVIIAGGLAAGIASTAGNDDVETTVVDRFNRNPER